MTLSRAESDLLDALAAGRATLLLGQHHSGQAQDPLLRDVLLTCGGGDAKTLPEFFASLGALEQAAPARRPLAMCQPSEGLRLIATNPWKAVWTSAVDCAASAAFQEAPGAGRRLRVSFAERRNALPPQSTTDALAFLRLFGAVDEDSPLRFPPLTPNELRIRRQMHALPLLGRLPSQIGPLGSLVITGLTRDDWLPLDDLAVSLGGQMPEGSVHWFPAFPGDETGPLLAELLGAAIQLHDATLADFIRRLEEEPSGVALAEARDRVFSPGDLTITIRKPEAKQIRVAAQQARELSQLVQVLDDAVCAPRPEPDPVRARDRLRSFLRGPQRVPDWADIASGYLFERDVARKWSAVLERALVRRGSVQSAAERLPWLVYGAPGSGKTRMLHWLALHLRRRGNVVLWASSPTAATRPELLARAVKTLEGHGAPAVALFLDRLEESEYARVAQVLASQGTNAIVVGAVNRLPGQERLSDSESEMPADDASVRVLELPPRLSAEEAARFGDYLRGHGFEAAEFSEDKVRGRHFLLTVHHFLPEARGGIRHELESEYERLMRLLDDRSAPQDAPASPNEWIAQLQAVAATLFPDAESVQTEENEVLSDFAHDELARDVVQTCLFVASLDQPAPLDLVLSAFPGLLQEYRSFSEVLAETAILHEMPLDRQDGMCLDAEHPEIAAIVLRSLIPLRSDQLLTLRPLVQAVPWDGDALPGENSLQDYMVRVFRTIDNETDRRGIFAGPDSIERFVDLLASVRTEHGTELPGLMLLEGNGLRRLADVRTEDRDVALERIETALDILGQAERLVRARRATPARNGQLLNILNTMAAALGFGNGIVCKAYRDATSEERMTLKAEAMKTLGSIRVLTAEARSLSETYYPSDVSFWSHRNILFEMRDSLTEAEQAELTAQLGAIMQDASQLQIEPSQQERYLARLQELLEIEGECEASEQMASDLLARGSFSGEVLLARLRVFGPGGMEVQSPEVARTYLERLESHAPGILSDPNALSLMNRLWMSAYLPRSRFSAEGPLIAGLAPDIWARWLRILEALSLLPSGDDNPYLGFCMGWAYMQLGEPGPAVSLFEENRRLASATRWRVGALAVLADEQGAPTHFIARLRDRVGGRLRLQLPSLRCETEVDPRRVPDLPLDARPGDELRVFVGLNYVGPVIWAPPQAGRDHETHRD